MSTNRKGTFIAFEGIDGSGKSTQIQLLSDKLRELQVPFYTTMEPADSPIGAMIHQILIGRMHTDPRVIAALFVADRLDHLLNSVNGVVHKIDEGIAVIMDRYYFSSYAYQSVDVPMDWLVQANAQSSEILRPTVNVFIDVDPELAMERIARSRFQKELFEEKTRLVQVRQKYFEAFERLQDVEQVVVIDGNQELEQVAQDVWKVVQQYFETGSSAQ